MLFNGVSFIADRGIIFLSLFPISGLDFLLEFFIFYIFKGEISHLLIKINNLAITIHLVEDVSDNFHQVIILFRGINIFTRLFSHTY